MIQCSVENQKDLIYILTVILPVKHCLCFNVLIVLITVVFIAMYILYVLYIFQDVSIKTYEKNSKLHFVFLQI